MERKNTKVTLKEIAEKAGTSIGTVDRAINNRTGISEERKKKILTIADELGYKPNRIASALRKSRSIKIGISYPYVMEDFYTIVNAGIDAAAKELADYGLTIEKIRYETQDPELAYSHLKQIDPRKYDGLIINSPGGRVGTLIDQFSQGGTPVITFNNDAPDTKRLFYVGSNPREAGMMAGELMGMLLGGKGLVTVLGNFSRATPFIERFGGFCEYLQPNFPEIRLFPCSQCNNDPEQATDLVVELLKREREMKGLFCTGYTATIGAIQALKALDRRDVKLVGFDISPKTVDAMEEQWCSALIYQDPYQQGYMAVQLLMKHLLENWLPKTPKLYIENRIVLRSNLYAYEKKPLFTRVYW
ncbi:MAG: LacI family transcriptional regulator [Clostridiales bacterium]|nr:LacI family transcriptional regulator [Clostridiales bacterium]